MRLFVKSPMTAPRLCPEHDLFIQSMKLKNTLRHLMGEDMITHLGLECYDQAGWKRFNLAFADQNPGLSHAQPLAARAIYLAVFVMHL